MFRGNHGNLDRERDRVRSSATRTKDKDQNRDKHKEKNTDRPLRHHSSHGKKNSTSTTSTSSDSRTRKRRSSMPDVESIARSVTASFLESRTSLPYPTFSKAHSKEDIWSKQAARPKLSILTPEPTDLTDANGKVDGARRSRTTAATTRTGNHDTPPSPPLTDQRYSRKKSIGGSKLTDEKDGDGSAKEPSRSAGRKASTSTIRDVIEIPKRPASHNTKSPNPAPVEVTETASESANDSDATSIAPHQPPAHHRPVTSPITHRIPLRNQTCISTPRESGIYHPSPIEVIPASEAPHMSTPNYGGPPPPPPPPQVPVSIPRVDYLLQNGGLSHRIPRHLLDSGESFDVPEPPFQAQIAIAKIFEPFHRLLEDYSDVMAKNGSLAVATGYRSVARRLLDRLEAVFARDISSETCHCVMCEQDQYHEVESGVSWGEVLELVSGRRELPSWPPFRIESSAGEQVVAAGGHMPMQKLDIDVPDEYREHYVQQSRKTKHAVDKWLLGQTEQSPPEDVDNETLSFAMMTHLSPEQRELFRALLGIATSNTVPDTPGRQLLSELLISSALAIQRLYRLSSPPRDCETAIYMLNNPNIHNVLATLAAISNDEWDILISGRFDGFLRSGAEDSFLPSVSASAPPRAGSRSSTPFTAGSSRAPIPGYPDASSRPASQPHGTSPAPASFGGPIALDEESEIASLAEIERNIYLSMEALEDAVEALHCKAEAVRRTLSARGAGLSLANQARRGAVANLDARLGTPGSVSGSIWGSVIEEDDGIDDDVSLAPDDSASNISYNRRRRPKRRSERRTPAPVEEEDEEAYDYAHDTKSPGKRQ